MTEEDQQHAPRTHEEPKHRDTESVGNEAETKPGGEQRDSRSSHTTDDDQDKEPSKDGENGNGGNGNGGNGDGGGDRNGGRPPSDSELRLLSFLLLIKQRTDGDITGFRAKRFYEQSVAESSNVNELYAKLKGDYIANQRDAAAVALTPAGREAARNATDAQTTVINALTAEITDQIEGNELLERLFWLAHANSAEYAWYLDQHANQINEPMGLLVHFFDDERFQSRPAFGSVLDSLPDIPATVHDEITDLLRDNAYLKGLAVIEGEAVIELLQLAIDENLNAGGVRDVLTHYVAEQTAEQVLADLAYAGLTEKHNAFNIDVDEVLKNHRTELQDLLTFDEVNCQAAFENNWDLVLEWHNDFRGRAEAMIELLADVGAVVPASGGFAVRAEVNRISREVIDSLQSELDNRISQFSNVASQIFFNFEDTMAYDEDVIVVLHDNSWSSNQHHYPALINGTKRRKPGKNPLTDKIILVPSPREFGFEDPHLDSNKYHCHGTGIERADTNREFNALGNVSELNKVKDKFNLFEWEQVNNPTVQGAEEILRERSKISLSEALDRLAEHEEKHLVALYTIADKATTTTSIQKNSYDERILWEDVKNTLQTRYGTLSEDEFEEVRGVLENILVDQADVDLIEFDDVDLVHRRFGERLQDDIEQRIASLAANEQRILYTFFSNWAESKQINLIDRRHQPEFDMRYSFAFDKEPPAETSLSNLLVKSGICTIGTYIDSYGSSQGKRYVVYTGVRKHPDWFRSITDADPINPSLDALDKYRENISQLAAIEYLIENDAKAIRSNLRDVLMQLDKNAMREFDLIDGIIAEQDNYVMLNPYILSEIDTWLGEAKSDQITDINLIKDCLWEGDIADLNITFDSEKQVYDGVLLTKDRTEIQVIIAPWLTATDTDWVDKEAIIILTNDYGSEFVKQRKKGYKESLFIVIDDNGLETYWSLPYNEVANPIIEAFGEEYEILQRQVDIREKGTNSENKQTTTQAEEQVIDRGETDQSTEAPSSIAAVSTSGGQSPSAPNLPAELFGSTEITFPGDILHDRPVVLLLHKPDIDRFGTTLQLTCRELYRQYEGGLPRGRIHDNPDAVANQLQAGSHIEFVDDSNGRFFNTDGVSDRSPTSVSWNRIGSRLQEMDTQGFGFLIFQLSTAYVDTFREDLENYVRPHRPQIVELEPPHHLHRGKSDNLESYLEQTVPRAEAIWGYPDLESGFDVYDGLPFDITNFDSIFTLAETRAWQMLQETATKPINDGTRKLSPTMVVRRHRTGGGSHAESNLHYALKAFTVRWLIESKGYDFGSVDTEVNTHIASKNDINIIPDIQVGDAVFEVETLYGTGMPIMSIKETIEKYQNISNVSTVTIVFSPMAAFLHYGPLKQLQYEMSEEHNIHIDFTLPVLQNQKLDSLDRLQDSISPG